MKRILILSVLVSLVACIACKSWTKQDKVETTKEITLKIKLPDNPGIQNYSELLDSIQVNRKRFRTSFQNCEGSEKDSLQEVLSTFVCQMMVEEILPHWYNTEWDYNGHTNIPNDGEIACGYLVSTSLKHFGFNLNRYKFAQQASYYEAKSLNLGKAPVTIRNTSVALFEETFKSRESDGLYIVGLDNHVGFLYLLNKELYFIHSDYISDKVKYELIGDSPAFKSSIYVYAPVSNNTELLQKWVFEEEIKVYTP